MVERSRSGAISRANDNRGRCQFQNAHLYFLTMPLPVRPCVRVRLNPQNAPKTEKAPIARSLFFVFNPGGDLRSRAVTSAVSSALRGLTSVFGMGTGVTLAVRPPETRMRNSEIESETQRTESRIS